MSFKFQIQQSFLGCCRLIFEFTAFFSLTDRPVSSSLEKRLLPLLPPSVSALCQLFFCLRRSTAQTVVNFLFVACDAEVTLLGGRLSHRSRPLHPVIVVACTRSRLIGKKAKSTGGCLAGESSSLQYFSLFKRLHRMQ